MKDGPETAQPQRQRLMCLRKHAIADQLMAQRRIVVGVDGSQSSKAALAWAVGQAKLAGAVVDAVTTWKLPVFGLVPLRHMGRLGATRKILDDLLAETGDQVEMRSRMMVGHAAKILVEASAEAELLVLGSCGHGIFMKTFQRSVSMYCVRHAQCAVVVIRGKARRCSS